MDYNKLAQQYLRPEQIIPLKYKVLLIFREFLKYKIWKYEMHKDLNNSCMAMGERVCLNIAFLTAIQKLEIVNLSPPSLNLLDLLDRELKRGVSESGAYRTFLLSIHPINHY